MLSSETLLQSHDKTGSSSLLFCNMVGKSPIMQQIFNTIKKVSTTDSTVLITGESGTGKELVANAIHVNSKRQNHPFIPINCAAIPSELIESELFGHEKGAFTGAIKTKKGRFELANNGTVFLDEIGDLPLPLQVKLLRAIQNRQIERVGGQQPININVRFIAATNVNLEKAIKEGKFREDLYYRLNVIHIHLPPLRERREDIPLLIGYFLDKFRKNYNLTTEITFDDDVLKLLINYDWPGNIRELENTIERALVLSNNFHIKVEDLPEKLVKNKNSCKIMDDHGDPREEFLSIFNSDKVELDDEGIDFNETVKEFEKKLILEALRKANYVKNRAAKLLKLNRTTLIEKMKKLNLNNEILKGI